MSCLQLTLPLSGTVKVANVARPPHSLSSVQYVCSTYPMLTLRASTKKRYSAVCLFGGTGKKDDGEASPWKSLEKAMGGFKKDASVEDLLRKQIEKQEYFGDGGSGGSPPLGGGSGGGGFGESEDNEESPLAESLQVFMAISAFIFLYIYIIDSEEVTLLIKDILRFLLTRKASMRLQRIASGVGAFFRSMTEKKKETPTPEGWLEYTIINTPTWWDSPEKYRRRRSRPASSESYY